MEKNVLGVRPYPIFCEDFSSYILRLCYLNGIDRISELLLAARVGKQKTSGYSDWSAKHRSDAMNALSVLLNRDKCKILDCSDAGENRTLTQTVISTEEYAPLYSPYQQIQRLNTRFIRICPTCVATQPVINYQWQYITVARCPEHKTRLIDCCPECDEPLKWHASVFEKCTQCGFLWSDYQGNDYENHELTDIEIALFPDQFGRINVSPKLMDDLCTLIVSLARPYDLFIDSFERLPIIQNYSDLLLHAIDCYVNHTSYQNWLLARQEYLNPLSINNDFALTVKTQSNSESKTNYTFNLPVCTEHIEYIEFVKLKRKKLVKDDKVEQLRHHIKAAKLAKCLHLTTKDFHYMVDYIKPINGLTIIRDRLYNIEDVSELLEKLSFSVTFKDKVILNTNSKVLRVFATDYGAVVKAILSNKIAGKLSHQLNLSEVVVEYNELIKFLKVELIERLKTPVSISKSASILGCGPGFISILVDMEKLQYTHYKQVNKISTESLLAYWHERYNDFLLREICGL